MTNRPAQAFTLVELLVVIVIITILFSIAVPIYSSVQRTAKRTQSMSNMRQFGIMLMSYCGDNNGVLPTQGAKTPTWAANSPDDTTAWYNVLPRGYSSSKGLGDYVNDPADFYVKPSLFYVPAAKYPSTKTSAPYFAFTFNSKLSGTVGGTTIATSTVRLQNMTLASETCIFQESGILGETPIRTSQSAYTNQPYTFASRSVARYANKTILVFADGHADLITGTDIVDTPGKAYYPQSGGKAYWTMDPTLNANQ